MKDNLMSVRMAHLSLPYDKPSVTNHQLYAHVTIATSALMTHVLLSTLGEKVDHCKIWSFSIYCIHKVKEGCI